MRKSPIKKGKKRIKPGKKTLKWAEVRDELKEAFYKAGITSCELKGPECLGNMFLGFAHSKKRANIKTDEELKEVIAGCQNCHRQIEALPKEGMYEIVTRIIKAREIKL